MSEEGSYKSPLVHAQDKNHATQFKLIGKRPLDIWDTKKMGKRTKYKGGVSPRNESQYNTRNWITKAKRKSHQVSSKIIWQGVKNHHTKTKGKEKSKV